eukprot:3976081-Amphidinium_carterae.1
MRLGLLNPLVALEHVVLSECQARNTVQTSVVDKAAQKRKEPNSSGPHVYPRGADTSTGAHRCVKCCSTALRELRPVNQDECV